MGAWDDIWPHRERLLRIARARCASLADAEDCVHDAMLRCATYDAVDVDRIGALLTTLTLRACADGHRARARYDRVGRRLAGWAEVAAPEPAEEVCDRAEAGWLAGRLAALGERERAVVLLRAAGRTTAEAARELGVSEGAAAIALTRAPRRLHSGAGGGVGVVQG